MIGLLLLAGCNGRENFLVRVAFPDDTARGQARSLRVVVVEPAEDASCDALKGGTVVPGDVGYVIENQASFSLPAPEDGESLGDVGAGRRLFYADAEDEGGEVFLRGCTEVQVGERESHLVIIALERVSQPCEGDPDCDDSNDCTTNRCEESKCVNEAVLDGTGCDDNLFCIINEVCQAGACQGESQDCSGAADQCNDGICNEDSDSCEAQPKPDGTNCDDGLFCNVNEACQIGNCTGGAARDCSFLDDQCNQSACDERADECRAQPINEGLGCNDGNFCTVDETCQSGVCTGIECNNPPDSWCDGITLVEYEPQGTCAGGSCEYAELRRDCLAGDCVTDHCETYLVAGFNFEGNSDDLRFPDHPPYHNGTVIGATPTGEGIRGGAYEFQSEQARIEVDTYPQFGEAFTWLLWIRARPAADQPSGRWPRIVSKALYHQQQGCTIQLGMLGGGTEGKFLVNLFGTDSNLYGCGGWSESLFDDQWHHLGLTWSQSEGRIRLYQDGQLEPACNTPVGLGVQPSASPLTIGANFDGSIWQYGNHVIDEVYLFDRKLTEERIQLIMNTGLTSDNL